MDEPDNEEATANEFNFNEFMKQFKSSFKATKSMLLSVFWIFVVTFAVFPGAFFKAGFDFD